MLFFIMMASLYKLDSKIIYSKVYFQLLEHGRRYGFPEDRIFSYKSMGTVFRAVAANLPRI